MAEQILKTRIALRINDYAYWSKVEGVAEPTNKVPGEGTNGFYVPYRGEVCLCEIPEGNATATTAPTVLFKVGNGTDYFKDLKWASGLAADVYPWAKKDDVQVEGDGNAITGATIKDGYLTFEKGETFATKGELDELRGGLEADTNTTYNFKMGEGDDAGKLVVEKKEVGEEAWTRVGAYDFVTPTELEAILVDYYTKNEVDGLIQGVRDDIPTVEEIKAIKVNNAGHADEADEAAKIANALTIKLTEDNEVVFDGSEAKTADVAAAIANRLNGITYTDTQIDELIQAAKDYADTNDANTAHTHTAGDGLKLGTVKGGIEGEVRYELNVAMKLEDGDIVIYDKDTENEVARLDAAELLEDSYLNDVNIVDNELQFTWKMDDGTTKTDSVDLKHLVDVYEGTANDYIAVSVADYKISAVLKKVDTAIIEDGAVTEVKLEQNVQDALALARTALQAQDITGKADKVEGATEGNFAALDADGNLVDSGKKAGDFATKTELAEKLDASGWTNDREGLAKTWGEDAQTAINEYGLTHVVHMDNTTTIAMMSGLNPQAGIGHAVTKFMSSDDGEAIQSTVYTEHTIILSQVNKDGVAAETGILTLPEKTDTLAVLGDVNAVDTKVDNLDERVTDLEEAGYLTEIEADTGLKVIPGTKGANNKVAIDTETVFILDCNF